MMPQRFVSLLLLSIVALSIEAADVFINAGGEEYNDSLGNAWEADKYFTSGRSYKTKSAIPVAKTEDDVLYLSGRYSHPSDPPMRYDIPVGNGEYEVTMHFTDTYRLTQSPGTRVFNVSIEGIVAFQDLDIVKEAPGGSTALLKTTTTSVTDSVLTIEFGRGIENPAVSAIEVHSTSKSPSSMFLNCGGEAFVDDLGNQWMTDTSYFNTGRAYSRNRAISGTNKPLLYQSQRYEKTGDKIMKYEIPVSKPGYYDVYLHFSDTYWRIKKKGQRLFNVRMEGSLAFENVDVFAETGSTFKALVKKKTLRVDDGSLTIAFERKKENPMVSGIEVHYANQEASSYEPAPTATPTLQSFEPIFINAGGPSYTDSQGNEWMADTDANFFNTGLTFTKTVPINDTNDETIYQSERWDVFNGPPLIYEIPVPNGIYDVRLHLSELFSRAQEPNKRVFDVFVEDDLVYEDLDIFAEVGGYTALIKETTAVVEDGALTIRFGHKIRDPKICGIEIRLAPPSEAPSMAPSISAFPTAPTVSPVPSQVPSVAPSIFPTETLLPWIDLNESEDYTARHECSFVQAGDKFYLFGGREMPKKLDIYDYKTNTWSRGAPAPKPFNHFQATVHEGLIWVIGSFETNRFPDEIPTNNVYVYDPAADIWMMGPSITWPRGAGGLVVYKEQFYLLGGNTAGHDGGFVPWLDRYDPRTGEWKLLRDAPHSRDHFHSVVIGNKLYAAGGRRTIRGNTLGDTVKEVDVYDFDTEEWLAADSLPQDLPLPRASSASVEFDGKLVLMGGETRENKDAYDRVDALDPSTGRWTPLSPMNHRRHGMQAIVSGEGIFVAGGSPRRGGGQQKYMEVYNANEPIGEISVGGQLGLTFGGANSVSIRHISGNQGVFVNSIELTGPSASDFVVKNKVKSRFLIPKGGEFLMEFEYNGPPDQEATAMIEVTHTGTKVLRITLVATR